MNYITKKYDVESVHLTKFPTASEDYINRELEEQMQLAQQYSSMVLSLRKRTNIRVRQPLNKILDLLKHVENLILSEVNVKEIEYLTDTAGIIVKKIKPNFKTLGPRYGKLMKQISNVISGFSQEDISKIENEGRVSFQIEGNHLEISLDDVEIVTEDIPGWVVMNMGSLTVALDITISEELRQEGIAREIVNRIQNIRKDLDFDVTDKIDLQIQKHEEINMAIKNNYSYICSETLAKSLELVDLINGDHKTEVELIDNIKTFINVRKIL